MQAVDSVLDCVRQRMDSPIYTFDVLFNLSSVGRKYHKGVKKLHTFTAKVSPVTKYYTTYSVFIFSQFKLYLKYACVLNN